MRTRFAAWLLSLHPLRVDPPGVFRDLSGCGSLGKTFAFWWALSWLFAVWILGVGVLKGADPTTYSVGEQASYWPSGEHIVLAANVNVTITGSGHTFWYALDGSTWYFLSAGTHRWDEASRGSWSQNPGAATFTRAKPILYVRDVQTGTVTQVPLLPDSLTGSVKVGTSAGWIAIDLPVVEISLNATTGAVGSVSPYLPPPSVFKEIWMAINNTTGVEQLVQWGSQVLKLAPGVNTFRYEGQVDSNGFPTVRPSDFQGTATTVNGQNYVAATLGKSALGDGLAVAWGTPPAFSGTPTTGKDVWELISPETATAGPTYGIRRADGTTTVATLPKMVPQTPTVGGVTGSATISNPTTTKPAQGSGSSVTNVTNNITNNTTTHNTTVLGNDGKPTNETFPDVALDAHTVPDAAQRLTAKAGTGALEGSAGLSLNWKAAAAASEQALIKLEGWNPLSKLGAPSGDFDAVEIPIPGGRMAHVALPVDAQAVGWFRACCLFALYLGCVFKTLKILKI